jgi:hypothetical protein
MPKCLSLTVSRSFELKSANPHQAYSHKIENNALLLFVCRTLGINLKWRIVSLNILLNFKFMHSSRERRNLEPIL